MEIVARTGTTICCALVSEIVMFAVPEPWTVTVRLAVPADAVAPPPVTVTTDVLSDDAVKNPLVQFIQSLL